MLRYKVKTDIFEGPFDLLVYLIEHAQMSVYDIKIAEITEQYIAYMENMKNLNIELAGEFMTLAATLIEIKSKMLLPQHKPDAAENGMEEDPRTELVNRLLEYKKFKAASEILAQNEEYTQMSLVKPQEDMGEYVMTEETYLELEISQFVRAFNLFLQKKKKVEEIHKHYGEIIRERISIEDKISYITTMLRKKTFFNFEKVINDWEDKQEIIVAFIAILELLRLKMITVRQHVSFGEIMIEKLEKQENANANEDTFTENIVTGGALAESAERGLVTIV